MARSKQKTPVTGHTTATTEKQDKRLNNRKVRRVVQLALAVDPETELLPHERELTDPWLMAKDGKGRFDPKQFPKLMRK